MSQEWVGLPYNRTLSIELYGPVLPWSQIVSEPFAGGETKWPKRVQ